MLSNMYVKKDKNNFTYGVIYGEGESSELLNRAINEYNLEYALLINLNNKRASIRGKGNLDCAKYAEKFGGGGHRCASGFIIHDFKKPNF